MLRAAGARLCEIASRFARLLKNSNAALRASEGKGKRDRDPNGDGDRPRSDLRDRASPEWAKTRHAASSPLAIAWGARYAGARPCPILRLG